MPQRSHADDINADSVANQTCLKWMRPTKATCWGRQNGWSATPEQQTAPAQRVTTSPREGPSQPQRRAKKHQEKQYLVRHWKHNWLPLMRKWLQRQEHSWDHQRLPWHIQSVSYTARQYQEKHMAQGSYTW